jgi:CRISPR system Cascade subunit CasE
VYSQERPDFTGFVEQYGWPLQSYDHTVRTVDFSTLSTNLEDGQEWFFQVTLNPTIKSHGDIIPLIKDQSDAWVVRKLSPVADIVSDSLHLESSRKTSFKKGDHRVTIRKSVYRGKLIITHKDEFIKMIANGIGRSKAYGCGLLTISR